MVVGVVLADESRGVNLVALHVSGKLWNDGAGLCVCWGGVGVCVCVGGGDEETEKALWGSEVSGR